MCRYDHGPLQQQFDPKIPNHDGSFMVNTATGDRVVPLRGFILQVWQCPQCSYVELHNYDPTVNG